MNFYLITSQAPTSASKIFGNGTAFLRLKPLKMEQEELLTTLNFKTSRVMKERVSYLGPSKKGGVGHVERVARLLERLAAGHRLLLTLLA
jgi:hypothetical protein